MKVVKNIPIISSMIAQRGILMALPAMALLLAGMMMVNPRAYANNINIHPATCVAPFLNQSFDLRWHEHFLLNLSTSQAIWVICPIPFDNDEELKNQSEIFVEGSRTANAGGKIPDCWFNVVSAFNESMGEFSSGPSLKLTARLESRSIFPRWRASEEFSRNFIESSVGNSDDLWAVAVHCLLPPGYGISQIQVFSIGTEP